MPLLPHSKEAWENRIKGFIDGEISMSVISKEDFIRN